MMSFLERIAPRDKISKSLGNRNPFQIPLKHFPKQLQATELDSIFIRDSNLSNYSQVHTVYLRRPTSIVGKTLALKFHIKKASLILVN